MEKHETDSSGNVFEKVNNIRITYKKADNVLSFRAYKNADTNSLHIGAELDLKDEGTMLELIEALCRLYRTSK